jgi:hypothetical protein
VREGERARRLRWHFISLPGGRRISRYGATHGVHVACLLACLHARHRREMSNSQAAARMGGQGVYYKPHTSTANPRTTSGRHYEREKG